MSIYVVLFTRIEEYKVAEILPAAFKLDVSSRKIVFNFDKSDEGQPINLISKHNCTHTLVGAVTMFNRRLNSQIEDVMFQMSVLQDNLTALIMAKDELSNLAEKDMDAINTLLFSEAMPL